MAAPQVASSHAKRGVKANSICSLTTLTQKIRFDPPWPVAQQTFRNKVSKVTLSSSCSGAQSSRLQRAIIARFQPTLSENIKANEPTLFENEPTLIETNPQSSVWAHIK